MTGRVVYFTMGLPIVTTIIFVGRAVSLENAGEGIRLLWATWRGSQLADGTVWQVAVGQVFFSTGVGFGVSRSLHQPPISSLAKPMPVLYILRILQPKAFQCSDGRNSDLRIECPVRKFCCFCGVWGCGIHAYVAPGWCQTGCICKSTKVRKLESVSLNSLESRMSERRADTRLQNLGRRLPDSSRGMTFIHGIYHCSNVIRLSYRCQVLHSCGHSSSSSQ